MRVDVSIDDIMDVIALLQPVLEMPVMIGTPLAYPIS